MYVCGICHCVVKWKLEVGGWVGERGETEKDKKTYNSNTIYFFSTNIYLIGTVTCTTDLNNITIIPTFG